MICDSKCCRRSGEKIWCQKNLGLKGLSSKEKRKKKGRKKEEKRKKKGRKKEEKRKSKRDKKTKLTKTDGSIYSNEEEVGEKKAVENMVGACEEGVSHGDMMECDLE